MKEVLHFIFGILGYVFGTALCLAPVITFYYVINRRSTEEFSGIPYVTGVLNSLLYTWYGLPFISSDNILVTVRNGSGALLQVIYVCLYLAYSPPKSRKKILVLFVGELVLFGVIAVVSVVALKSSTRALFIGIVSAAFAISMYGAPLSIMKLVIETRSVEYMPFFLSLFVFLCGFSWFVYGILGGDPFVAVPNGVGTLLGAAQLALYWVYRDRIPTSTEDHVENLIQNA